MKLTIDNLVLEKDEDGDIMLVRRHKGYAPTSRIYLSPKETLAFVKWLAQSNYIAIVEHEFTLPSS